MVLKKNRYFLFFVFFFLSSITQAQDNSYNSEWWSCQLQTAFSNSPKVRQLINNYTNVTTQKKQYDYSWFPLIQAGFQDSVNIRRGDYIPLLNQTSDSEHKIIITPAASISVFQKLPANGQLSLSADYAFSYLLERKSFIQYPQLQLQFNQPLSRGAFGILKDPEYLLIKEQVNYSRLTLQTNLFTELQNILNYLQALDILCTQQNYYDTLKSQYESEFNTAKEKNNAGLQSGLEEFYAQHQYTQAQNKLKDILFEKEKTLKEIKLLIPNFNYEELDMRRNELKKLILDIFHLCNVNSNGINPSKNLTLLTYSSIIDQYKFQYKNEAKNYSPILYLSSSLKPDSNFNSYYSDWYKSFRAFKQTPYPVDFSLTIGIQARLEVSGAKKLRKEIYNLYSDSVRKEMLSQITLKQNELTILLNQITNDTSYIQILEDQLVNENNYRIERKGLYEKGIITLDEFYKGESMYFLIYSDYVKTIWNNINNQLTVIDLCAGNSQLMNTLLGDFYGKIF